MELTTPQIYALSVIAACVAVLIGITYCAGLKTGRQAADGLIRHQEKLNDRNRTALAKRTTDLVETNRLLDSREAALAKLRQCLREEQSDHDKLITQLREALNREIANRLTHDDWLTLKLATKQLGVTAHQFAKSGSSKTNQAALAQARINDMANRVKEALDEPQALGAPTPQPHVVLPAKQASMHSTWERVDAAQPATVAMCM